MLFTGYLWAVNMTAEEKVLEELKEKINILFAKISELKVTEAERKAWEEEKKDFNRRIADYKLHKAAFQKRVEEWNLSHQ